MTAQKRQLVLAGFMLAKDYSQEYLEKVSLRAWSATASVTEP
jgi:hypothetical protein